MVTFVTTDCYLCFISNLNIFLKHFILINGDKLLTTCAFLTIFAPKDLYLV